MMSFGRFNQVPVRNDLPLFRGVFTGTEPGQNGTIGTKIFRARDRNRDKLEPPPFRGGVHCPVVTGRDMSLSRPGPGVSLENRNDDKRASEAQAKQDPASRYPTKASRLKAADAWEAEYLAWEAAGCPGGPDAWPRPPAGLLSALMDSATKPKGSRKWR